MKSTQPTIPDRQSESRYPTYLLLALVVILLVVPVIEFSSWSGWLLRAGVTVVLVLAVFEARRRKAILVFVLVGVSLAAPASWLSLFIEDSFFFLASCLLQSVYFVAMAVSILNSVILRHRASVQSIFGAISAYLLLGLAWAVLYWGIDHVDPHALEISHRHAAKIVVEDATAEITPFSQFVYFSFVTMSTLGYGDMTPTSPITQTLAWMQSVTGQFYIAVLVAWLVSELHMASPRKIDDPE